MTNERFERRCSHCGLVEDCSDSFDFECTKCHSTLTTIDGPFPARRFQPTPGNPFRLEDLQPMRDRILVRPLAMASRSQGGLHLPEMSHQRERPMHGIVVRTGPGAHNRQTDTLVPMQVRVDDCVFYGKYSGQEFTIAGQAVLNMGEIEVFSVLPAGTFVVVEHEDAKLNHLQGDYCDLCATPEELAAKQALEDERTRLQTERIAAAIAADPVQSLAPVKGPVERMIDEGSIGTGPDRNEPSFLEQERERLRQARQAAEEPPARHASEEGGSDGV